LYDPTFVIRTLIMWLQLPLWLYGSKRHIILFMIRCYITPRLTRTHLSCYSLTDRTIKFNTLVYDVRCNTYSIVYTSRTWNRNM